MTLGWTGPDRCFGNSIPGIRCIKQPTTPERDGSEFFRTSSQALPGQEEPPMELKQRRLAIERPENRWQLADSISQVGYFDTWDSSIIPSTDVAGSISNP